MHHTLTETFKTAKNVSHWQRAFQLHQPLRNLFWRAFNDVNGKEDRPDPEKLTAFWDKCAAVTVRPEPKPVQKKTYFWQKKTDAKGTSKLVRQESDMPEVVLYTPWTKKLEYQSDPMGYMGVTRKAVKYIDQPAGIKSAVKRACEKVFLPKKKRAPALDKIKL